ncbi:MAG: T9SS type A sorting domain-containing protein [Pedobacter sp.]|nr:MAG: T9SS type A sorting domain-containing protein [Pedobacter sp.]
MVFLLSSTVFAQKVDTAKVTYKPKSKVVSRVPQIKANITPYKPNSLILGTSNNATTVTTPTKTGKILSVLKVYPNPVSEQVNISLRLDREITLVVKITDMLGNDVLNLANERAPAGEQTKTYTIPSKLNTGMYFLKVLAGGEQIVKKISVL